MIIIMIVIAVIAIAIMIFFKISDKVTSTSERIKENTEICKKEEK